jgi:hypothetical protein
MKTSIEGIGIYTNEDRTFKILINQTDHIEVSYQIKDKGLIEAISLFHKALNDIENN